MMIIMTSNTPSELGSFRRDLTAPLWERVANIIASEIALSPAGSRMPSESKQCDRFKVSRVTLRQALSQLQEKGLIESKPGLGWFVVDRAAQGDTRPADANGRPLSETPGKLMSFTDMALSRGSVPDSVVLEQRVRPATFDEAEALVIMPGADVLLLRRLRRLNGFAVAVDRSIVPLYVLPNALNLDLTSTSLHASLRAAEATPSLVEIEVQAIVADEEKAHLLGVDEGFPLLKVRQAFFDSDGRAVEQGVIIYRGDRYRYRSRLRAG
jgi:GntR family transcriptional regulator